MNGHHHYETTKKISDEDPTDHQFGSKNGLILDSGKFTLNMQDHNLILCYIRNESFIS